MNKNDRNINITETEIERQNYFTEKVKAFLNENRKENKKHMLLYIHTFGCQMNAHDSEKIEGMFLQMGITRTDDEKKADFIVYNTCCVRENAENRVYGNLGYLKNEKLKRPNLKIILGGCMMQQDTVIDKIKSSYRHVDVIFGTFNIHRLPELIYTNLETNDTIIDIWEEHGEIIEDLPVIREKPFKASVNIMYGCNNYCSYCIVPYVRGRERSRESADIVNEVKKLAADGVKEIMLLGQNVNSYGVNLKEQTDFATLLKTINEIPGLERIRFMTSHPKDLSDSLILAIRDCEHVCKHLHLPVQSGSTEILNKMNRKYSKEDYLTLIDKIKAQIPGIFLSTDIIVGFPGETEADFNETLELVRQVGFSNSYTFQYSPRIGTPAATGTDFGEPVSEDEVKDRFSRLLNVLNEIAYEINKKQIGTTQKVLVEEINKQDNSLVSGRAENNCIVHVEIGEDIDQTSLIGQIIDVRIDGCKTFYLVGKADRSGGDAGQ